jgi:hypothetical protein
MLKSKKEGKKGKSRNGVLTTLKMIQKNNTLPQKYYKELGNNHIKVFLL